MGRSRGGSRRKPRLNDGPQIGSRRKGVLFTRVGVLADADRDALPLIGERGKSQDEHPPVPHSSPLELDASVDAKHSRIGYGLEFFLRCVEVAQQQLGGRRWGDPKHDRQCLPQPSIGAHGFSLAS